MNLKKLLLALILIGIPISVQTDVLYLKDGSVLVGKLVKTARDTVYFETSFGTHMKVCRTRVLRIQFGDSISSGREHLAFPRAKPADPGSLVVSFSDLKISNKIIVHRNRDYARHEQANAIESILIVDGETVASYVDSTMDKTVRKGPDKILKNTIKLTDFHVALDSGPHNCLIIVRNPPRSAYENHFEHERLNLKLSLRDVIVYPGRTTQVEIGLKRGTLGLGTPRLYWK